MMQIDAKFVLVQSVDQFFNVPGDTFQHDAVGLNHLGQIPRQAAWAETLAYQLVDKRRELLDHVELGIQLTADAFHCDEGLGQEDEVAWKTDAMAHQDTGKIHKEFAGVDLLEGQAAIIVDKLDQDPFANL